MPVRPRDVAKLVGTYRSEHAVTIRLEGSALTLTSAHESRISLELTKLAGGGDVSGPLDATSVEDDALVFSPAAGSTRTRVVWIPRIKSAELTFRGLHPRDEALVLGLGWSFFGPNILGGPFLDIRPVDWAGLELGALASPGLAWGFAALRLSPVALGRWRPYSGAFVHALSAYGEAVGDGPSVTYSGAGIRLGLELSFDAGHAALRAEVNLVRRLGDVWVFNRRALWGPYGGFAACHYF